MTKRGGAGRRFLRGIFRFCLRFLHRHLLWVGSVFCIEIAINSIRMFRGCCKVSFSFQSCECFDLV